MKPLAELQAHAIEGVVFDVDDTITRDGVLELCAFEALHALRAHGLIAIAATGRPLGWSDGFAGTWPIAAAVGENGAGWAIRSGALVETFRFDPPEHHAAQRAKLDQILDAVRTAMPDVQLALDQPARRADLAFDVGERKKLAPDRIAALCAIIEGHGARTLVSTVHAHAIVGAWDKAKGAMRAAEQLGIVHERLRTRFVFVGDSGNDAAGFAHFEQTVGVANVAAHLGKLLVLPRFVTTLDRGRGFAELVQHLIAGRS